MARTILSPGTRSTTESRSTTENRHMPVSLPSGFPWEPINVWLDKDGAAGTDFDCSVFQPVGKTYYVTTSGDDEDDGLTEETAFRSLSTAIQKEDVDVIMVGDGHYASDHNFQGYPVTRSVSIKAISGTPLISGHRVLSWSKTAGMTRTYEAEGYGNYDKSRCLDLTYENEHGDYKDLVKRGNISAVDIAGSFFPSRAAGKIYISLYDSRAVDEANGDFRIYVWEKVGEYEEEEQAKDLLYTEGDTTVTIYIEGITFEGGNRCINMVNDDTHRSILYAKNCTFRFASHAGSGVSSYGCDIYLQNCENINCLEDGFTYTASTGNAAGARAVEINCTGRDCGWLDISGSPSDTCNGSTSHGKSQVIRVGGSYYRNRGPNVADVQALTYIWNIGVTAYGSIAPAGSQSSDFCAVNSQNHDYTKMWLHNCVGYGSTYALWVQASVSSGKAAVYLRNCSLPTELLVGDYTKTSY